MNDAHNYAASELRKNTVSYGKWLDYRVQLMEKLFRYCWQYNLSKES